MWWPTKTNGRRMGDKAEGNCRKRTEIYNIRASHYISKLKKSKDLNICSKIQQELSYLQQTALYLSTQHFSE